VRVRARVSKSKHSVCTQSMPAGKHSVCPQRRRLAHLPLASPSLGLCVAPDLYLEHPIPTFLLVVCRRYHVRWICAPSAVCSAAAPSLGLCILQVRSRTHRCSCSVVQSSLSSSTTEATEVPGSHAPVAARARPPSSAGEGGGHHRGIAPSDLCYGLGHDQA